jgi:hypothetical protein
METGLPKANKTDAWMFGHFIQSLPQAKNLSNSVYARHARACAHSFTDE